jgi:hypothetical protein
MRRAFLPLLVGLGLFLVGCPKKSPSAIDDDPVEAPAVEDQAPDDEAPDFDDEDDLEAGDALEEEPEPSLEDDYDLDDETFEE